MGEADRRWAGPSPSRSPCTNPTQSRYDVTCGARGNTGRPCPGDQREPGRNLRDFSEWEKWERSSPSVQALSLRVENVSCPGGPNFAMRLRTGCFPLPRCTRQHFSSSKLSETRRRTRSRAELRRKLAGTAALKLWLHQSYLRSQFTSVRRYFWFIQGPSLHKPALLLSSGHTVTSPRMSRSRSPTRRARGPGTPPPRTCAP